MSRHKSVKKSTKIISIVLLLIFAVVAYFMISDYVKRQTYPLKYTEIIKTQSQKYDLDPFFVCAVIYTESKFNPNAVSGANASGLMQLMPVTAKENAVKAGIDDYKDSDIFDPEINIELGCWYLNYIENRFGSDITIIAAAYNAGPSKVASWLKDSSVSQDGKTLTNIPYSETENYVKRIQYVYDVYKDLYKEAFN